MMFDELTQLGSRAVANHFSQGYKKSGTTEQISPAVVNPQTNDASGVFALTTSGQSMDSLDIVPGKWFILQQTSQLGSSYLGLVLESHIQTKCILSLLPSKKLYSSLWKTCGDRFECSHLVGWFMVGRGGAACTLVLVYVSILLSGRQ
jgi:hypothetical protein